MRTKLLVLGILTMTNPRLIGAQSIGDAAAYEAMVLSPVAAVSPVVLPYMTGAQQTGIGIAARYGHMSLENGSTNTVLADLTGRMGRGSWGVEAGYLSATCQLCNGHFMTGTHAELPLVSAGSNAGNLFTLGLQGTVGFALPTRATVWALGANAPFAYSIAAGRVRVVPFVAPGVGYGGVSADMFSESGTRFSLGGGVGVTNIAPGLAITAGMQKVFITGGRTAFGLGVNWSRSR